MRPHLKIVSCVFLTLFFFTKTSFADENNAEAAITNAQLGMAYLKKGMYSMAKKRLLTAIADDSHLAVGWY